MLHIYKEPVFANSVVMVLLCADKHCHTPPLTHVHPATPLRPVPIILFFLPIILFRISQNILLLFLRIDPIILIYSHKNSGKLNNNIAT